MIPLAIHTEGMTCDFGAIRAVDDMTMQVPAGIIFGFLGPNGAGKTTTIRLLLGLLEPTAGRAEVLGFDTRTQAEEIRTRAGALLEHDGIYEHLSAADNLEFYARVWHLSQFERQDRIKTLLGEMGLWDRRHEQAGKWSRGMKQKLALARALIHRPRLLLLDEPTAGLDVPSANAVRKDLAALVAREGVTVFLTTHNMAEAERLCHQIAVIREGHIVALGHPDELRARSDGNRVEIVGSGFKDSAIAQLRARPEVAGIATSNGLLAIDLHRDADAAPLVSLLVCAGAQVEGVHRSKASLEDVFLTLIQEEQHA